MKRFDYLMPSSIKEAIEAHLQYGNRAKFISGGTDVLVKMKQKALDVDCLISLRRIPELKGIEANGNSIRIGAMTTFREIIGSSLIKERLPALWKASSVLANPQIRNVATIGGNISNAAPSADSVPPLMVLDTKLIIQTSNGLREEVLEDFFLGPGSTKLKEGEVLKEIVVKLPSLECKTFFIKIGRVSQDIAVVNGAIAMETEGDEVKKVRCVLGAVAPTPLRLKGVEEKLLGQKITPDLIKEVQHLAEAEVRPITDVRASMEYRRHLSGVIVKRLIEMAIGS